MINTKVSIKINLVVRPFIIKIAEVSKYVNEKVHAIKINCKILSLLKNFDIKNSTNEIMNPKSNIPINNPL